LAISGLLLWVDGDCRACAPPLARGTAPQAANAAPSGHCGSRFSSRCPGTAGPVSMLTLL